MSNKLTPISSHVGRVIETPYSSSSSSLYDMDDIDPDIVNINKCSKDIKRGDILFTSKNFCLYNNSSGKASIVDNIANITKGLPIYGLNALSRWNYKYFWSVYKTKYAPLGMGEAFKDQYEEDFKDLIPFQFCKYKGKLITDRLLTKYVNEHGIMENLICSLELGLKPCKNKMSKIKEKLFLTDDEGKVLNGFYNVTNQSTLYTSPDSFRKIWSLDGVVLNVTKGNELDNKIGLNVLDTMSVQKIGGAAGVESKMWPMTTRKEQQLDIVPYMIQEFYGPVQVVLLPRIQNYIEEHYWKGLILGIPQDQMNKFKKIWTNWDKYAVVTENEFGDKVIKNPDKCLYLNLIVEKMVIIDKYKFNGEVFKKLSKSEKIKEILEFLEDNKFDLFDVFYVIPILFKMIKDYLDKVGEDVVTVKQIDEMVEASVKNFVVIKPLRVDKRSALTYAETLQNKYEDVDYLKFQGILKTNTSTTGYGEVETTDGNNDSNYKMYLSLENCAKKLHSQFEMIRCNVNP
jgi:hypothetical protein